MILRDHVHGFQARRYSCFATYGPLHRICECGGLSHCFRKPGSRHKHTLEAGRNDQSRCPWFWFSYIVCAQQNDARRLGLGQDQGCQHQSNRCHSNIPRWERMESCTFLSYARPADVHGWENSESRVFAHISSLRARALVTPSAYFTMYLNAHGIYCSDSSEYNQTTLPRPFKNISLAISLMMYVGRWLEILFNRCWRPSYEFAVVRCFEPFLR